MVTDRLVTYRYDWGEPVKIAPDAPDKYSCISQGSICGIRVIETEIVATDFDEPMGTVLYLVEGGKGDAIEIPEKYLMSFDLESDVEEL